jgi:hypothetical protein
MKTILLALLASASIAQANIIQVFDNFDFYRGFETATFLPRTPLTAIFGKVWEGQITEIDKFVSFYKLGNDTDGFHSDFFLNDPTDTATISWDLPRTSSMPEWGSNAPLTRVRAIEVRGENDDFRQLFFVTPNRWNRFEGEVTFTLPKHEPISTVYIWGTSKVPEGGSSLALLAIGCVFLLCRKSYRKVS